MCSRRMIGAEQPGLKCPRKGTVAVVAFSILFGLHDHRSEESVERSPTTFGAWEYDMASLRSLLSTHSKLSEVSEACIVGSLG